MLTADYGASRRYEDTCAEQQLHRSVIPDTFWTLTKLTKIDFEYACVGGPVSEAIGNMTALTSIEFHGNYLNGSIPQNVGKLVNLETFKFGRNPFTGQQTTALLYTHTYVRCVNPGGMKRAGTTRAVSSSTPADSTSSSVFQHFF